MLRFQTVHRPETVEEALALKQKYKTAPWVGGGLWLRLSKRRWPLLIDISAIGQDRITESETEFTIGALVTQREVEMYAPFQTLADGVIPKALHSIIGVQFRNMATIGGSIGPKFGFSDILPTFVGLHAEVTLAQQGRMPLLTYIQQGKPDLVLSVHIPKQQGTVRIETLRKSAADFPILTLAVRRDDAGVEIYVGARPGPVVLATQASALAAEAFTTGRADVSTWQQIGQAASDEVDFQTNSHASAAYRQAMTAALVTALMGEV